MQYERDIAYIPVGNTCWISDLINKFDLIFELNSKRLKLAKLFLARDEVPLYIGVAGRGGGGGGGGKACPPTKIPPMIKNYDNIG